MQEKNCKFCKSVKVSGMNKEEFKEARKSKRLTQAQLAGFLGVSYSAVTKWEVGQNPIPSWVAEKLSTPLSSMKIAGLSAEELAALERHAAQKGVSVDSLVSDLIRTFIRLSVVAFLAFHLCRTPADWSKRALASTFKAALSLVSK